MVLSVQDQSEDGFHGLDRNLLLFGALHIKDVMFDAVFADEGLVAVREILAYQRTNAVSVHAACFVPRRTTYTTVLSFKDSMKV